MGTTSRDRRARATGRRGNRADGIYAQLPCEVLESNAGSAMPDYAMRVLIALAAAFRGSNNGDLSLPLKRAQAYGINTQWKLSAGLAILEHVGLIERTRTASIFSGKGIAALYALGWRPINRSEKYDQPSAIDRPAPNRWAHWERPANWQQVEKGYKHRAQGKNSEAVSTRVDSSTTHVCTEYPAEQAISAACERPTPGIFCTHGREPSRSRPGAASDGVAVAS